MEDPDDAWIDGEVVGVNGEDIKVLCTSGKTVRILYHIYLLSFDVCNVSIIIVKLWKPLVKW